MRREGGTGYAHSPGPGDQGIELYLLMAEVVDPELFPGSRSRIMYSGPRIICPYPKLFVPNPVVIKKQIN